MPRITGYLAQLINTPPLVFRFQFNPEMLQEKRSYKYKETPFSAWNFANTGRASGLGKLMGLYEDAKAFGPKLTRTKGLEAEHGEPRVLELEFKLDASVPGPMDTRGDHYGGSIEPDLALLRSFVQPAWDPIELTKGILQGRIPEPGPPPLTKFVYAGLSIDTVMKELNIKHTAFQENGKPLRADVSCTLHEQTLSVSPLIELITRNVDVALSYNRDGFLTDALRVAPVAGGIMSLGNL